MFETKGILTKGTLKKAGTDMISIVKFVFRLMGLAFLAIAIIAGISDASTSIAQSQVQLQPLGQLLFGLFPDTFPILQPAIERHVHPALWDPVLLTLMTWPVWAGCRSAWSRFFVDGRPPRTHSAAIRLRS